MLDLEYQHKISRCCWVVLHTICSEIILQSQTSVFSLLYSGIQVVLFKTFLQHVQTCFTHVVIVLLSQILTLNITVTFLCIPHLYSLKYSYMYITVGIYKMHTMIIKSIAYLNFLYTVYCLE